VLANQKGIVLACENREPDAVVSFDAHCLSGALMNLVSNAIKFTERGSVTVRVARGTDGALELAVVDTGVGIAPDYVPRLFESFSQEDQSTTRRFEGSGLGLALVKRYAELNDARVSVTSTKAVGSTFVIRFAPESEVVKQKPVRPTARDGAVRRAASGKPLVLVVEDDPDSQAYMRVALRDRYDVLFAATADEARGVLATEARKVRIILLDIALNGSEDGLTFVRSLRKERAWSKTPIIATTALALPADERNAHDAGCTAYLSKPLKRDVLLRLMQDALAGEALRTAS
jgi:CheY-like chemotaxis protein